MNFYFTVSARRVDHYFLNCLLLRPNVQQNSVTHTLNDLDRLEHGCQNSSRIVSYSWLQPLDIYMFAQISSPQCAKFKKTEKPWNTILQFANCQIVEFIVIYVHYWAQKAFVWIFGSCLVVFRFFGIWRIVVMSSEWACKYRVAVVKSMVLYDLNFDTHVLVDLSHLVCV